MIVNAQTVKGQHMSQLTSNFWRHEIRCRCGCGLDTIDWKTLEVAQQVCDHFAKRLQIPRVICRVHSASRCGKHNAAVGGSPTSQHLFGRAMDISIVGVKPQEIYDYLCAMFPDQYGFGLYKTFAHIDTRSTGPARWEV